MPTTVEEVLGDSNLFARPHTLREGEAIDWHAHPFDHTTYCFVGRVRVYIRRDGTTLVRELSPETRDARKCVVYAGWEHRIEALTDGAEIECVYAHRDPQGRVHQRYTGWDGAYA